MDKYQSLSEYNSYELSPSVSFRAGTKPDHRNLSQSSFISYEPDIAEENEVRFCPNVWCSEKFMYIILLENGHLIVVSYCFLGSAFMCVIACCKCMYWSPIDTLFGVLYLA